MPGRIYRQGQMGRGADRETAQVLARQYSPLYGRHPIRKPRQRMRTSPVERNLRLGDLDFRFYAAGDEDNPAVGRASISIIFPDVTPDGDRQWSWQGLDWWQEVVRVNGVDAPAPMKIRDLPEIERRQLLDWIEQVSALA